MQTIKSLQKLIWNNNVLFRQNEFQLMWIVCVHLHKVLCLTIRCQSKLLSSIQLKWILRLSMHQIIPIILMGFGLSIILDIGFCRIFVFVVFFLFLFIGLNIPLISSVLSFLRCFCNVLICNHSISDQSIKVMWYAEQN